MIQYRYVQGNVAYVVEGNESPFDSIVENTLALKELGPTTNIVGGLTVGAVVGSLITQDWKPLLVWVGVVIVFNAITVLGNQESKS
jgi:uncharacterized membrane protein YoaK (UPF0700 family)